LGSTPEEPSRQAFVGVKSKTGKNDMSCDHVWFCPTLYRKDWIELTGLKEKERERIRHQYQAYGSTFAVKLSAVTSYCFDELYIFLKVTDAIRFFAGPLADGETSFKEVEPSLDDERSINLDYRSLMVNGKVVASDQPSHWDREHSNQLPNRPKHSRSGKDAKRRG
jgi:hypothetical protein